MVKSVTTANHGIYSHLLFIYAFKSTLIHVLGGCEGVAYPGESGEVVQLLHKAEHLQADGRHDNKQASCEHHQAA